MNDETKPDDDAPETVPSPPKKKRGFGGMDPEKRRAIASAGGKAAHAAGTAYRWNKDEAIEAGRKGGTAPHRARSTGRPRDAGST